MASVDQQHAYRRWAKKSESAYNQDKLTNNSSPDITTGAGQRNFRDKWFWAELLASFA